MRTHANTLGDRNENVAGEITLTVHICQIRTITLEPRKKIRFRNLYNNKINESKPYDWSTKRVLPLLIFLYKKNSTSKSELKQVEICYEKYKKSV